MRRPVAWGTADKLIGGDPCITALVTSSPTTSCATSFAVNAASAFLATRAADRSGGKSTCTCFEVNITGSGVVDRDPCRTHSRGQRVHRRATGSDPLESPSPVPSIRDRHAGTATVTVLCERPDRVAAWVGYDDAVNPIERAVRVFDRAQQRSRWGGLVFGVVKKYGDDRGPALAALLTHYGFMSLFPLLLILTTILGFIGNARIEHSVVGSALKQFPVYGQQLGDVAHPLSGSTLGLAFGLFGLLYGALGAAQSAQHAMAQVWNVPGVVRPGYGPRLGRGLVFFGALGFGIALPAALAGVATANDQRMVTRVALSSAGLLVNVSLYVLAFRILTPKIIATRDLVPGAVIGGVGYTLLVTAGTALVQHQLRHAQVVYGQFGFVLGLIGWLYLVSQLSLYAAELNVVRSRRLWPRSIVQPPLTDADQRVLHDIAHQEERRPEQRVGVGFGPDAGEQAADDANEPPPQRWT